MPQSPMVEVNLPRFGKAVVRAEDIDAVICHRIKNQLEEYLVKWKGVWSEDRIPHSWHPVHELAGADGLDGSSAGSALTYVQQYVDLHRKQISIRNSKKRKLVQTEGHGYRLSPIEHLEECSSRASSMLSIKSDSSSRSLNGCEDLDTYNCNLEVESKKYIIAKATFQNIFDSRILPAQSLIERAKTCCTINADAKIRAEFMRKLQNIHGKKPVKLVNIRDQSTPPLSFQFINDYVYRKGIEQPDPQSFEGCQSCSPNMGGFCGCEYTKRCECLEFAEINEQKVTADELERSKLTGSSMGLPKRFPYSKGTGLLVASYLQSGSMIYECNKQCKCHGSDEYTCKSRVVQYGRQISLEIFKTRDRGWGLRCTEDLRAGQFIDTYRGEVITDAEANLRGDTPDKDKDSYLFSLDKFSDDGAHVIDGQHMGGPSRFINHSCDSNCGIYTVSHDKNNRSLYELAFFATRDIPALEELTFDYKFGKEDKDQAGEEVDKSSIPCKCGSKNCRKWLWK